MMLKGLHWSEVHHLRLHSSKGTTNPHRELLKITQRGLSIPSTKVHLLYLTLRPCSSLLLCHYLDLKAPCRLFVPLLLYCTYFPLCLPIFFKVVHMFPIVYMFGTDSQKHLCWWQRNFYTKLLLGLSRKKLSKLNCPLLHVGYGGRFSMLTARRLFVLATLAFDFRYQKCVRVRLCVFFRLLWKCHRDLPHCIGPEQYCILTENA